MENIIPTPTALVEQLARNLRQIEREEPRSQLTGMAPDDAFDCGYRTALRDLRELTHPTPEEEN